MGASVVSLLLDLPPSANHHYTLARGRIILTARAKAFRESVYWDVMQQTTPEQREGLPERLFVLILLPESAELADADNAPKELMDALKVALGFDDSKRRVRTVTATWDETIEAGKCRVLIGAA